MTDFTKTLISMLRTDPHIVTVFGPNPPICETAPDTCDECYVTCQVKPESEAAYDINLTIWMCGNARADIQSRLDALASAIRTGRLDGIETSARRIRLMDIFLDDSGKTRNGLLRARFTVQSHKIKEKQQYETIS